MLRAAREAVAGLTKPPLLIGVTILTSLDDAALARVGFSGTAREHVEGLARLAKECGLDGVVCSAQEAPWVRAAAGTSFTLVTPGIRLDSHSKDDQARTVTPPEAIRLGADYLVIGRPITRAADPVAQLEAIRESLGQPREAAQ
jgi:orotidine-5'-phosphate decarboxylase